MGIMVVIAVGTVLVPAILNVRALTGPVSRRSVERFARLHSLAVTAGNGNQIIAYRATTRRWRTAGLVISSLIQYTVFGVVGLVTLWVIAGWFAGAIAAELRVAHLARGHRTAASLTPRRAADYLPPFGRFAVPASMAICASVAVLAAVRAATGRPVVTGAVTTWTVLGLAIGAATLAATRHVLRRPQPVAEADRLAADDAIRSRSLHVLAGAGTALVLYCVLAQLWACGMLEGTGLPAALGAFSGLVPPLAGCTLAYRPWVPRRAPAVAPA